MFLILAAAIRFCFLGGSWTRRFFLLVANVVGSSKGGARGADVPFDDSASYYYYYQFVEEVS